MNKEEYLRKKNNIDNATRSECKKCLRPTRACFCEFITRVHTDAKIVILMHPTEMKKGHVGTGRLAHLSLTNSQIIVDKDFDSNSQFNKLISDNTFSHYVLYPSENPLDLNCKTTQQQYQRKPALIFIIDATWPRAKKMFKNTTKLHRLSQISFKLDAKSLFTIKQQPTSDCLSTIESVLHLLNMLKEHQLESPELELRNFLLPLRELVRFHKEIAMDESQNSYRRKSHAPSDPEKRVPSKKWQTRSVYFKIKNT